MFAANEIKGEVILSSQSSKVVLWPLHGAILNSWEVTLLNRKHQVIDGYDSFEDIRQNGESKGFRSMKLSPFVCRLANGTYRLAENSYTIKKFYLGNHAIHGLLYDKEFSTEKIWTSEEFAAATFLTHYHGEDSGYPFAYSLLVTYKLLSDNQLNIETVVTNYSDQNIPIADGWHPYFTLGNKADDWYLQMNAAHMLEFDEELLPTGRHLRDERFLQPASLSGVQLDNCFVLDTPGEGISCALTNPSEKLRLEIMASEAYPYLQIYTPPHRESIAIENLSAAPDSFNNNIGNILLSPGASKKFETCYRLIKQEEF